jgi:hypothetical protein
VAAAQGADLLVHEATFADDEQQHAVYKKHSTMGEALEVAARAGAYRWAGPAECAGPWRGLLLLSDADQLADILADQHQGVCGGEGRRARGTGGWGWGRPNFGTVSSVIGR